MSKEEIKKYAFYIDESNKVFVNDIEITSSNDWKKVTTETAKLKQEKEDLIKFLENKQKQYKDNQFEMHKMYYAGLCECIKEILEKVKSGKYD